MQLEQPNNAGRNQIREEAIASNVQNITLLPLAIQLQNIFPVEIVTRKFAVDTTNIVLSPNTSLNIEDLIVNTETLRAQATLTVQVNFSEEPSPFEISFKLVGIFSYEPQYSPEMVHYFLQHGSLSVLLPAARQLLLDLCIRLQVPMVMLPLIQLTPPSGIKTNDEKIIH